MKSTISSIKTGWNFLLPSPKRGIKNDILKIAKENRIIDKYLNNKLVKNIIFVQNRLINILTDE